MTGATPVESVSRLAGRRCRRRRSWRRRWPRPFCGRWDGAEQPLQAAQEFARALVSPVAVAGPGPAQPAWGLWWPVVLAFRPPAAVGGTGGDTENNGDATAGPPPGRR
ncbi:MAG: hypothetical protein IPH95_10730 [Candidatus Promineofilum sp.]|nr:hypothetical protein [Promineifilum sp.]